MMGADRACAASRSSDGSRTPGSLRGSLNTFLRPGPAFGSSSPDPRVENDPVRAGNDCVRAGNEPVRAGNDAVLPGDEPVTAANEPVTAVNAPVASPPANTPTFATPSHLSTSSWSKISTASRKIPAAKPVRFASESPAMG